MNDITSIPESACRNFLEGVRNAQKVSMRIGFASRLSSVCFCRFNLSGRRKHEGQHFAKMLRLYIPMTLAAPAARRTSVAMCGTQRCGDRKANAICHGGVSGFSMTPSGTMAWMKLPVSVGLTVRTNAILTGRRAIPKPVAADDPALGVAVAASRFRPL